MRLVCVLAATTHDVPLIATIAVSLAFAFVGGLLNKSTGNVLNVDGGVAMAFVR